MSSVIRPVSPLGVLAFALLGGQLSAQPFCDVLIQPAFHYSTNGLALVVADSSRTYGINTTATWTFGDGTTASLTPEHQFSEPGTYTVCLTLTALPDGFCASTYCRDVRVPLDDCGGVLEAYFASSGQGTNSAAFVDQSNISSGGSWSWDFGDGNTSNDPMPSHAWAVPGTHFVALTREVNGCSASYARWVEVDGNATTCGPGLFVDFANTSDGMFTVFQPNVITSGVTPILGIWSYGDGTIDTALVGGHFYQEPGIYQTCFLLGALAGSDSCFSLICRTFNTLSAISIPEHTDGELAIWPNPTTGSANFHSPLGASMGTLRVRDVLGRTVRTWDQVLQPIGLLDLHGIPDGHYLLEISTTERRLQQRFQIAH